MLLTHSINERLINVTQDRNFDDLAHRFKRNVYDGLKGAVRLRVLERDFAEFIPALATSEPASQRPLRILDAGGGQGQFALTLAAQGHAVALCDISTEMLRLARQQVELQGLDNVELIHAPIQALAQHIKSRFDLVLCHAVLEWVAEPRRLLRILQSLVAPGGFLSLTFYNRHSLIYKNLLRTNFKKVQKRQYRGYRGSLTPTNPLDPAEVYAWLEVEPMTVLCKSGIRVFHDYIFDKRDRERDPATLIDMELQFSRLEPYRSLGRYIHVLCQLTE